MPAMDAKTYSTTTPARLSSAPARRHARHQQRRQRPHLFLALTLACIVGLIVLPSSTANASPTHAPAAAPAELLAGRYANHKVVRVYADVTTGPIARFIQSNNIDLWSDLAPLTNHADLRLSPAQLGRLHTLLPAGVATKVIVRNVGELVASSFASSAAGEDRLHAMDASSPSTPADPTLAKFKFDSTFLRYSQVMEFVDDMVAAQPGLVSKSVIGKSHEGRDIVAVRVGLNSTATAQGGGAKPKSSVIVLGGVHAREWASVASVVNSIHNFASHGSTSPRLTTLLSTFDIHYVPITNPDGYEYTFTGDRLWRKNRQPLMEPMSFNSTRCVGIDINRNFPTGWQPSSRSDWADGVHGAGPCGLTYPGSKAAEAIEVKAVTEWAENLLVKEMKANVTAFYDVHAYSQLWMYPPGYSCTQQPHNPTALARASLRAKAAITRFSGASFTTGQICPVLYAAAGCSTDWAYELLKTPYSFAIELSPGRDDGAGFLLPADRIRVTAGEMQAGFLASLEEMAGIGEAKESEEVVPGWGAVGSTSAKGETTVKNTKGTSGARKGSIGWVSGVVAAVVVGFVNVLAA